MPSFRSVSETNFLSHLNQEVLKDKAKLCFQILCYSSVTHCWDTVNPCKCIDDVFVHKTSYPSFSLFFSSSAIIVDKMHRCSAAPGPSYSKTKRKAAVCSPAELFRAVSSNVVNSQVRRGGCETLQCKCTSVMNHVCQCAATLYLHQVAFQKNPVSTQMCSTYLSHACVLPAFFRSETRTINCVERHRPQAVAANSPSRCPLSLLQARGLSGGPICSWICQPCWGLTWTHTYSWLHRSSQPTLRPTWRPRAALESEELTAGTNVWLRDAAAGAADRIKNILTYHTDAGRSCVPVSCFLCLHWL